MKKEDLILLTTLISNIGVIAGLFFLGYELRQNAEATKLEMIQANRIARIEGYRADRDSPFIGLMGKARRGEELTQEENERVQWDLSMRWAHLFYDWGLRDLELGNEYIQNDFALMKSTLSNPRAMLWWERAKIIYPRRFIDYVENWDEEEVLRAIRDNNSQ